MSSENDYDMGLEKPTASWDRHGIVNQPFFWQKHLCCNQLWNRNSTDAAFLIFVMGGRGAAPLKISPSKCKWWNFTQEGTHLASWTAHRSVSKDGSVEKVFASAWRRWVYNQLIMWTSCKNPPWALYNVVAVSQSTSLYSVILLMV